MFVDRCRTRTPQRRANGRSADLVVSLERHEALRAAETILKDSGDLIYYDTVWQPLAVRLDEAGEVSTGEIQRRCSGRDIRIFSVFDPRLPDIRMQNMAVLGDIALHRLIPDVDLPHYRSAMDDLMAGLMLKANQAIFERRLKAERGKCLADGKSS